ncbi:MAG: LLM class flavin-dependent oxidoreductase [Streptosporangiales bacterium]|nr:LLM class flavin-dependent oxidoreductase [Streptosporangiales bacterium]
MMTVRFGITLTNQHPLGSDQVAGLEAQLRLLHAVRDHGWDSVFAAQHHLSTSFTHIQPLPYLARLAADAGDMNVGIGIHLLALHNPVETAESYASLDAACGGRLIFGVGLGYRQVEYDAFGVPAGEKVRRFEENLRIVTALWSGEPVHADLPWCRLDGVRSTFLPTQRPRPPIWMAANSDNAVRRAARTADTWLINPHATIETIQRQLKLFDAEREAAGRGPVTELPAAREIYCAPTRERALELAMPYLANKYQVYAEWGQDTVMPDRESFRVPYEELEKGRFIVGSPDDCLEQLLPWRDKLGVNHFVFRTDWAGMPVDDAIRSVDLLSREVLPVLRESPS